MQINSLGEKWERMAESHLIQKGFHVIERNYYAKMGEIDIIMKDGSGTYVFIEVKKRKGIGYGRPLEYINARKMKKIIRTAEQYIAENKLHGHDFRFDAVEIIEWSDGEIELNHIENIFLD
ncbi:MAG: YraN family protein [Clostridiales bacterium]|nr:MAG: YraN family protein [Clostridiales bacterium]